ERRARRGGGACGDGRGRDRGARRRGVLVCFRSRSEGSGAGERMSVRIKLCGVRTVADALLCAEAGADEIGVIFARSSKRRVAPATAKEIRTALPPHVGLVGVFSDATADEIDSVL